MPRLLKNIRDEMKKLPRDPNKYPKLQITKLETRNSPGIKSITYKSVVKGEHKEDYITFIQFFGVLFENTKKGKFTEPAKVGKELRFHPKPSVIGNKVNLKCSCQDFRFVWEFPLFEKQALIGRFRKYIRVPGSTRPPRNPDDLMGLCKHVWSMLNALNKSGTITEVPKL